MTMYHVWYQHVVPMCNRKFVIHHHIVHGVVCSINKNECFCQFGSWESSSSYCGHFVCSTSTYELFEKLNVTLEGTPPQISLLCVYYLECTTILQSCWYVYRCSTTVPLNRTFSIQKLLRFWGQLLFSAWFSIIRFFILHRALGEPNCTCVRFWFHCFVLMTKVSCWEAPLSNSLNILLDTT